MTQIIVAKLKLMIYIDQQAEDPYFGGVELRALDFQI